MNQSGSSINNPIPPEFEVLKDMEAFSEAMFNRIVEFQEGLHAAWKTEIPFDKRIKGLALHCLMFSNPDRDPEKFAHTIAPFYPLRAEFRQIAHIIKQLGDNPRVVDVHAGNGFIGSLLAREGLDVVGLREPGVKPNQIAEFYDDSCYTLKDGSLADVETPCDVIFSSWMPSGRNDTAAFIAHKPKMNVYIHTDHVDQSTGLAQTGTVDAFTDLPAPYQLIAQWSIARPQDMLREVWPELSPNIEEVRHVKIYVDGACPDISVDTLQGEVEAYDWEEDLNMILVALQAKEHLRDQGISV